MPTYDYHCKQCDRNFEEFQPITAPALDKCPKCGGGPVIRLISPGAGVLFKGSGFYQTDYRSSEYKKKASQDGTSSVSSSSDKSSS